LQQSIEYFSAYQQMINASNTLNQDVSAMRNSAISCGHKQRVAQLIVCLNNTKCTLSIFMCTRAR